MEKIRSIYAAMTCRALGGIGPQVHRPLFGRFGFGQSQLPTDANRHLVIGNISPLNHNRRCHGQVQRKVLSVRYSALGLDLTSISTAYFSPSLGTICLKCFQGLPFGLLTKVVESEMKKPVASSLSSAAKFRSGKHFSFQVGFIRSVSKKNSKNEVSTRS